MTKDEARKAVKDEMLVVPTKSGKHIICKPFNKQTFAELWKNFSTIKQMDIHPDNPTILYVP